MGEVQHAIAGTGFRAVRMDIDNADGKVIPISVACHIDRKLGRPEIDSLFGEWRCCKDERAAIIGTLVSGNLRIRLEREPFAAARAGIQR